MLVGIANSMPAMSWQRASLFMPLERFPSSPGGNTREKGVDFASRISVHINPIRQKDGGFGRGGVMTQKAGVP